MICKSCRYAGTQTTLNNSENYPLDLTKLINAAHEQCPGGTWCDCQHYTGQALNTILIAALARGAEVKRSGTETVTTIPVGFRSDS
jgi:hypothetical protein